MSIDANKAPKATAAEIRCLCDRLLARANSVLMVGQPEQAKDMRLAAQILLETIHPVDEPKQAAETT